jgi:hypothetical protein
MAPRDDNKLFRLEPEHALPRRPDQIHRKTAEGQADAGGWRKSQRQEIKGPRRPKAKMPASRMALRLSLANIPTRA